jgi:UDP-N-acetylglucosamine 3-dehydrogenase
MKKVRVGMIGCGGIACGFHLRELTAIPEVELLACCDRREVRAKTVAEKYGFAYHYTDHHDLLARDDVDAVVVATYHPTHAPIACDALAAGKHVLVQKPMATRMEDADRLVKAAAESDRLTQCLPFVWSGSFRYASDLIERGALGKICMARVRIAHNGPEDYYAHTCETFGEKPDYCAFFSRKVSEGGAVLDMGVYAFSLLTYLLGPARSVTGMAKTLDKDSEVDDSAAAVMDLERGAIAIAETSWCQPAGRDRIAVYGTEGTLYMGERGQFEVYASRDQLLGGAPAAGAPDDHTRPAFGGGAGWFQPDLPHGGETAHGHFIHCILNGTQPLGRPEQARHVVEIMLGLYESERTGQRVTIKSRP